MKLEQHFYTSGKTEFTTIAVTEGITRDERIQLEQRSIYFLPVSLHHQENIRTPVKYIWYPLHKDRFVVGKAVYKGKDSLGRTGNYLFHNIIISNDDLMTSCRFNPARVILWLEKNQIFKTTISSQAIKPLDLPSDQLQHLQPGSEGTPSQKMPRDVLLQVLYICIRHEAVHQPLLLLGTEQECLVFLDQLYGVLPYHIREELCVDTYAYGVSLGFQVIGSLPEEEFRQGLISSLTLQLADLRNTLHSDIPEPSKYLSFVTDMAVTERMEELDAVYSLEYCLQKREYARFKQEYPAILPELQNIVWDFHENTVIKHIAADQDTELMLMIQDKLSVENINTLYLVPEMISRLIETGDRSNIDLVAIWLCTEGSKRSFYPYLFKSHELWKAFLKRIQTHPHETIFLLEPVKAFQGYYTKEFEETLLEQLLIMLPHVKTEKKVAKELLKAFEALDAASISPSHLLLRTFIKYDLSKDAEFLEQLIDSDLSGLTQDRQTLIFDSILDRILVVRSLKIWNPTKAEQQIRKVFEHASGNPALLFTLLGSIEKLQLSGDVRDILQNIFSDVLTTLPKENVMRKQISGMMERILRPPSSLFDKISEKVFSLKKFYSR